MYSNTEYTKKQVITVVIVAEEWSTEFTSKAWKWWSQQFGDAKDKFWASKEIIIGSLQMSYIFVASL